MSSRNQKTAQNKSASPSKKRTLKQRLLLIFFLLGGMALACALTLVFALTVTYNNLPSVDSLTNYHPKVPLRIYSADHVLIGEFGEERRKLVRIEQIPYALKKAIIATEDDRFYEHSGVDYIGIMRAALNNMRGGKRQGASTITQQVARNFFLTTERSYKRKILEVLLAWKIEKHMSKDEILEIYMNHIYLGQRAYGFASASEVYFDKQLSDISIAEAAMLAGLPKAPSAYNPITNLKRATQRQKYILMRMHKQGYISSEQYAAAKNEEIIITKSRQRFDIHAKYVAEMARQMVQNQYGDDIYSRGLNVYTTILKKEQNVAYNALRKSALDYDKRHGYRKPIAYLDLPQSEDEALKLIKSNLHKYSKSDNIVPAIVLAASKKKVTAVIKNNEIITINPKGLFFVKDALSRKTQKSKRIRRGAVIHVMRDDTSWVVTQIPKVEAAFVAINTSDGAIRALVGGFDFHRNEFNHVTQAWRQPGSSFKPFIFSAALERGLSPATRVSDLPITFTADETGDEFWEPRNYSNTYENVLSMRQGLEKSKNMVSIRIMNEISPVYARNYISRFGFSKKRNPAVLTLALGAGSVSPLQLVAAHSVFANGGYKVNPYLISRITNIDNEVIAQAQPVRAGQSAARVIDERNAFLIESMMKGVIQRGSATRAKKLDRPDIAGKTGTTNDSHDAWFAGYHANIAAVSWVGFDHPKNLGRRETGGGAALPIWIDYMRVALDDMPIFERPIPRGIIEANGDYYYAETPPGTGVESIGLAEATSASHDNFDANSDTF